MFEHIVESGCDPGLRLGESLEADMIAVPEGEAAKSAVSVEAVRNQLGTVDGIGFGKDIPQVGFDC